MDSRLDTAVTVEQLPVPLPLDADARPTDLATTAPASIITSVQESLSTPPETALTEPLPADPPSAEPQQDAPQETLPDAPVETDTTDTARTNETPATTEVAQTAEPTETAEVPETTETQEATEATEDTEAAESAEPAQPTEATEITEPTEAAPETDSPSAENAEQEPELEHAYWADEEEDTSVPDEAELKEIESQAEGDYSALEYNYWEKNFYPVLDDPEYRPVEKARLTWKIKGVRGTKENPNRVKIMRSPPAFVGGYWWTIKFFPRGNNVGSLSVYIECSSTPPKPDGALPETEFKVLRGPADTELDVSTPDLDMTFGPTEDTEAWNETFKSQYPAAANASETAAPETWRVSAQIGVIVYNPDEPRTGWMQSSCHQFNPHNLDWGWTNFHSPWDQIHRRQRGQRQALLRNDTLAFDAYIRIFDDPTRSLWWHMSDSEPTWDSLGLTGYRPLGDSVINHSADVAGLATWLHIAPFCKIIQNVNVLEHLTNCDVKPKPLCDALQKFLWQLRQRDQSLQYVDTDNITTTLRNLHESSSDVCEFWERLRRSLELELAGTSAAKELSNLFDSPSPDSFQADGTQQDAIHTIPKDFNSRICVPADQVKTTAEAFNWYLGAKPGKWALPPILHLELGRQTLDKAARQWRLLYNRVELDEELDLSQHLVEGQTGKYVLYGYIVHRGRRTSGKFFSILRPGGPGTKWLAFDDGSDNRVECLTRKTALGPHVGLEESQTPDHKTGHDVAIAVMYIRSDVVKDYLPGPQGPWEVSEEIKEYYESGRVILPKKADDGNAEEEDVQVEVYSLQKHDQLSSLFDTYDLMSQAKAANSVMYLSVPRSTNLIDVRKKIATWAAARAEHDVNPENVRLWQVGHTRERFGPTLAFIRISDLTATLDIPQNPVRYWLQIVSDADAKYFAMNDPAPVVVNSKPEEAVVEQASSETSDDAQPEPATEGAEPSSSHSTEPSSTPDSNREATEGSAPVVVETSQADVPIESAESLEATTVEHNAVPAAVTTDTAPAPEPSVQAPENPAQVPEVPAQSETQTVSNQAEEPTPTEDNTVTAVTSAAEVSTGESNSVTTESPSEAVSTVETTHNETSADPTPSDDTASAENDAVIAAIIADDLQQLEGETQDNQPADAPASNQEPAQTFTTEDQENTPAEETEPEAPAEPEVILPVDHVYYYIQLFDIESQTLKVVGSFFSQKEETIKSAIRKHLDWPETKDFQVWQRIDGTTVITLASAETFDISPPDGTCFIVGDKLNKEKRAKLNETGLFANPDPLVRYTWAESRNHPIQAFTGTKTIDATFTSDYYSGEIMKGYYHGKGKHISDSAATYTGDYVLSKKHGNGLMEYPTGDTYDGDWYENQCHGQGTFIERKTGNKYVGGYKDGKRHGKGISYWEVADEEMDLCQICFGEEQDALFYDCGHVCACVTCARQVEICPICRKNILNVVKIYRT
ncbi:hypothetical protein BJY01DRAFT_173675 [Aspergillus pseudoustus]|uniref:MATH and UCH domain protein n=1 Tax=Aspergillus pseudoustus TaxID=1810923 RepID=A0ABR4K346_9EURO